MPALLLGLLRVLLGLGRLLRARTALAALRGLLHRRRAVRARGPGGIEGAMARRAHVLQARMAVRAQDVVVLHRIAAVGALAVLHELALLEGHLELLLVTVDLQKGRTQQAVRHDADERDEGDDAPHIPIGAAHIRIAGNPHDGQDVQDGKQHDHDAHGEHARPHQVHKAPGDHIRQPGDITHHAGHQPANGGGVVKAERKLLELCKRILPDVVAHVHFQPARAAHKQEHAQALDDDQSGIYKAVQPKPLSGAALDEMVDGIAVVSAEYEMKQVSAKLALTYAINNKGAVKVTQKMTADKSAKVANMFRFGMQMVMPASFEKISYYGRGPVENYADRNHSTLIGKYRQTVAEQFYPYIRPQETGTKTDLRRWRVLNISGNGLQFVGDAPFSASALNYSIESLDDGVQKDQRHSPEVAKAPFTNLCIDKVQMGLGCVNSWGTLPLEKYRVPYQDYEFSFILTPVRHKVNM